MNIKELILKWKNEYSIEQEYLNYAKLENNALDSEIARETMVKIQMFLNDLIKIDEQDNDIKQTDNYVIIRINGDGYIKDMMEEIISDKITDFEGEYHLYIDDEK